MEAVKYFLLCPTPEQALGVGLNLVRGEMLLWKS